MAILMSLSLFCEAHATWVTLSWDDQKKVEFLSKSLPSSKYSTNKVIYPSWLKYFDEGKGGNSQFQLEASFNSRLS